jgi:hypothetical protein
MLFGWHFFVISAAPAARHTRPAACHCGEKVEEGQYNIKFDKNYKLIAPRD